MRNVSTGRFLNQFDACLAINKKVFFNYYFNRIINYVIIRFDRIKRFFKILKTLIHYKLKRKR